MNSEKLNLTLFDILGYLLPGFLVIFCLSLIESTFFHSSLLSLASLGNDWFLVTLAAYFSGHICHIIASLVKVGFINHLGAKNRSENYLYKKFKQAAISTYQLDLKEADNLSSLDFYLLADSYVVASGGSDERNSLIVREGFYKTTTIAFGFLFLTTLCSIFSGGLKVQMEIGNVLYLGIITTIVLVVISFLIFLIFGNRFIFYNRMKLNNTYLLFLAYQEKNNRKK
jgi:hypothetical protein